MKTNLLLLLAICISACQSAQNSNEPSSTNSPAAINLDSVKAHIAAMNKTYTKRFITRERSFYEERYCVDATVYPPNRTAVAGIDSIAKFFYVGDSSEATMEIPSGNIFGNGEFVVEDATYNFPDGKGGSFDKGKFIAIWKQEDGKWKLYREIWNSDLPIPTN